MVAMSNINQDWNDDDDFEFEDYSDEPQRGSSSEALKKVRRAERAKDKQLKEALAELENLRKAQRESIVGKVLSEKGVNPKVAAFIPQDIEPNAESVSSWLEQYGDVFGVSVQESSTAQAVDPSDMVALQQMNAVTSGALLPEGATDLASAINNAQSEAEILALFAQFE
jgi:hypothetical protein